VDVTKRGWYPEPCPDCGGTGDAKTIKVNLKYTGKTKPRPIDHDDIVDWDARIGGTGDVMPMLWCSGCGREEDAPYDEGDQCSCGGRFVDERRKLFQPEEGKPRVCLTCGGSGKKCPPTIDGRPIVSEYEDPLIPFLLMLGEAKDGRTDTFDAIDDCPDCDGTGEVKDVPTD
jgi:RecJ-like exonuclease